MHIKSKPCTGCQFGQEDFGLAMAFQPIVDMASGLPFAFEALVRGPNGESAGDVLARVTEETRYAFDQQCRVAAIEQAVAAGILQTGARLSINFLPNAVYSPVACIQLTLKTAKAAQLPTARLIFEFTENERIEDTAHVQNIVETYQRMGFATAIDDFGAGHAGLGLLARFQPDIIKLDMELIRGIDASLPRRLIVDGVIRMARALGIEVIAEGIESVGELDALQALGVRYMQGYLLARPVLRALPVAVLPGNGAGMAVNG
jgi:EAL domain-containing protein (putative c-di-GMP-specific phosphodiesterase class I)